MDDPSGEADLFPSEDEEEDNDYDPRNPDGAALGEAGGGLEDSTASGEVTDQHR